MESISRELYDCVIIGGGAAGLSAANILARARRKVVVVDAGDQSNKASRVAHSVFGHDNESPNALYELASKQLQKYSVAQLHARVTAVVRGSDSYFHATLDDDTVLHARTVLLAQGVEYQLPSLPGLRKLWGTKAWHCPYCDGYEHRDQKLLVITEPDGVDHMSLILPSWSKYLTYAVDATTLTSDTLDRIRSNKGVIAPPVTRLRDTPTGVQAFFSEGIVAHFDSVIVGPTITPRDSLAQSLRCKRDEQNCIKRDEHGRTTRPNVYVAGDQTDIMQQVNIAVASGHKAAVAIHEDLARQNIH